MESNTSDNDSRLVRYKIIQRRVYVEYAKNVESDPRYGILLKNFRMLSKLTPLPDLDFVVSLHDSCPCVGNHEEFVGPVMTFAKHGRDAQGAVLIPDPEALDGNGELLQEVALGKEQFGWDAKLDKAFWRGATTGGGFNLNNFHQFPRSQLVALSLQHPSDIDARFSSFVYMDEATHSEMIRQNFSGNSLSVSKHLAYKYQVLVDGNTCAYSRAIWQLFSNSLMFKQDSPQIQWFYRTLKPYVHYVPVASDFSDLVEKIHWARAHDATAREIVASANAFAQNNLNRHNTLLYLYLLLTEYAKLQRF